MPGKQRLVKQSRIAVDELTEVGDRRSAATWCATSMAQAIVIVSWYLSAAP